MGSKMVKKTKIIRASRRIGISDDVAVRVTNRTARCTVSRASRLSLELAGETNAKGDRPPALFYPVAFASNQLFAIVFCVSPCFRREQAVRRWRAKRVPLYYTRRMNDQDVDTLMH